MNLNRALIAELEQETINTKKILSVVPSDKFNWKPHKKSMSLIELSQHIAGLVSWVEMVLNTSELDVSNYDQPSFPENTEELIEYLDSNLAKSLQALEKATNEDLQKIWTFRMGNHVVFELPKMVVIRTVCLNHLYHHRGQLSVYLRLLDVKIPGMYGPSADDEYKIPE